MYKNRKIKNAQPTIYNGIKFRSKLEAECAKILDSNSIKYEYEPFKIELLPTFQYDGKTYRAWTYTPDFVIFKNIIIEVKGYINADNYVNKRKMILKKIIDDGYKYEFYEIQSKGQLLNLINNLKSIEHDAK